MKSSFERVVEAIHAKLRDRDVEFAVGQAELSAHGGPKRVVWVQRGGRLAPPTRGAFMHPQNSQLRVRPLLSNIVSVQAFIQAPDAGELEQLWTDVLTATRAVFGSGSTAIDYVLAGSNNISGRGDRAELMQTFEWTLVLAERGGRQHDSTTSGAGTVTVLAFETTEDLDPDLSEPDEE